MPQYTVNLIGRATMYTQLTITADSPEQAEAFAIVKSPTDAQLWQVEPMAISEVEVTEVLGDEDL